MSRTTLIKSLRITWTVCCGIACLALIALWVRSYWLYDTLTVIRGNGVAMISDYSGKLFYSHIGDLPMASNTKWSWKDERLTATTPPPYSDNGQPAPTIIGFGWFASSNGLTIVVPYISLVPLAGVIAILPWLPWWSNRFSLRTLLVAITLVAVVLGVVVWAMHG